MQARAHLTRTVILAAASSQFDTLGYAETSISSIVAAGELTKGAIYFHFSSKEAIAHQLINDWTDTLRQIIAETDTPASVTTHLRRVFTELAHQLATNTHLRAGMKLTLEPSIDDDSAFTDYIRDIHGLVENAIIAGELEDHPVTRRLAWNLCTGTVGATHAHTTASEDIDLALRIDDVVIAHLWAAQNAHNIELPTLRTDLDSERTS